MCSQGPRSQVVCLHADDLASEGARGYIHREGESYIYREREGERQREILLLPAALCAHRAHARRWSVCTRTIWHQRGHAFIYREREGELYIQSERARSRGRFSFHPLSHVSLTGPTFAGGVPSSRGRFGVGGARGCIYIERGSYIYREAKGKRGREILLLSTAPCAYRVHALRWCAFATRLYTERESYIQRERQRARGSGREKARSAFHPPLYVLTGPVLAGGVPSPRGRFGRGGTRALRPLHRRRAA